MTLPIPGADAYLHLHVGHEHGEAGEVCAGAGGVCAIGGQQATVLRGPESRHGALGVAPERTVGIEVLFRMLRERERGREGRGRERGRKQVGEKKNCVREREEERQGQKGGGRGGSREAENGYLVMGRWEVEKMEHWESQGK